MENSVYSFKDKKDQPINITLTSQGLQYKDALGEKSIKWNDFIGIYIPFNFGKMLNYELIHVRETTINYNKHGIHKLFQKHFVYIPLFSQNAKEIVDFRNRALECLYKSDQPNFLPKTTQDSDMPYYKKALVFINPHAGNGRAKANFKKVQKILSANGIFYNRVISQKDPFVKNLIRESDSSLLLSYDLIICISGDGIPHEILNGYFARTDIDFQSHHLTIALVPSGGGCALSENMLKLSYHHNSINNSLFKICHFRRHPVNVQKYDCLLSNGNTQTIYGFLNANYGFFASVNKGSEKLRFLSHYRFKVYGIWHFFFVPKKHTKIEMLTCSEASLPPVTSPIQPGQGIETFEGEFYSSYTGALPFITRDYLCSPTLLTHKNHFDVQISPGQMGKGKLLKYLLGHKNHKTPNDYKTIERVVKQYRLTPSSKEKEPNIAIDGESYKSLQIKCMQASMHDHEFFSLV
jgi:hypothetical protein